MITIINKESKNKFFNLEDVINEHFVQTDKWWSDQRNHVRPIEAIKEIRFHEDNKNKKRLVTKGLLEIKISYDNEIDCEFCDWYFLESYNDGFTRESRVVLID